LYILIFQRIRPSSRSLRIIYGGKLLLPSRGPPNPRDHPLSAIHDCSFNIFAVTLHIGRSFPPTSTLRRPIHSEKGPN
jgi:hypothetical protein